MSWNKLLFCPNYRGDSFSYFREKRPSVSLNYCYKIMPQNNITQHVKIFQSFFHDSVYLDPFYPPAPTHLFTNTPIIKDKKVLSFSLRRLDTFFIHI